MSKNILPEAFIEPERYELHEAGAWELDRRQFFRIAGGGVIVALLLGDSAFGQRPGRAAGPKEVGGWLHVGEDGVVTVYTGKVEIGQNIRTSLTQVVAEELRTPVERIRLVMADTALTPYDMGTFGSSTTPQMASQLRRVAAAAREELIGLAAEQGKVDRATLTVKDGKVVGKDGKPSFDFGELTKGKKLMRVVGDAPTTPADKWTTAGTSVAKVDGRAFVTGPHEYASDVKRPGMLVGKVLRPPSFKATLVSVKTADAEAMPGVKVVHDGDFVGVAAPSEHEAEEALDALKPNGGDAAAVREGAVQVSQGSSRRRRRRRRRPGRRSRGSVEEAEGGRRQAGSDVHGRLYRPWSAGAAGRRRGVGRRQADRLDRDATAVRRARRTGAGVQHAGGPRPRDRARHGFGLRRQAHRRGGDGGGAAGQGGGQAGQAGVDARGRIHLGLLPAGRRHRREGRRQEGRDAHGLGVPQLQLRRLGPGDALRRGQPSHRVPRGRLAAEAGVVPRPGGHGQRLRPRIAHGRSGPRHRHGPAGLPPEEPQGRAPARGPGSGGGEVRLGQGQAGRRPRLRHRRRHGERAATWRPAPRCPWTATKGGFRWSGWCRPSTAGRC